MNLRRQDQGTTVGFEQGPSKNRYMQVLPQVEVTTVLNRLWHTKELTELEVGRIDVLTIIGTTTTKRIASMASRHRAPVSSYQMQLDVSFKIKKKRQSYTFFFHMIIHYIGNCCTGKERG